MRIISLLPYFLDENDTEHDFDNGNERQYNLIVNVLGRAFNLPNIAEDIEEEDGVFIFTLEDDNINVGNVVNNVNNIPAEIAGAGFRLMFNVVRIVQRRNVNNRQEGGRKRRQRSNKKKRRTYRKKTNKRRKRSTRKYY